MSLLNAYKHVLDRKPNIGPNRSFFRTLIKYEAALHPAQNPSITLHEYLVDQVSRGPGSGFPMELIDSALTKACDDPNTALSFLFG